MKFFKLTLLLIVFIGFVSVADASLNNTFTNSTGGTSYYPGQTVTSTVISNDNSGHYMLFKWCNPANQTVSTASQTKVTGSMRKYTDTFTIPLDAEGGRTWFLYVYEYKKKGEMLQSGGPYEFTIYTVPEFLYESFISLLVGVSYFGMRKKMAGFLDDKK